jgi:hypothetical protein
MAELLTTWSMAELLTSWTSRDRAYLLHLVSPFIIEVRTLKGEQWNLRVSLYTTIAQLKLQLQEASALRVETQTLFIAGNELELQDHQSLHHCGVCRSTESSLFLVAAERRKHRGNWVCSHCSLDYPYYPPAGVRPCKFPHQYQKQKHFAYNCCGNGDYWSSCTTHGTTCTGE